MGTKITFIRHGETDWNVNGRWQGQAAVPLNAWGRRQADVVASYVAAQGERFAALYASDLSRAYDTAGALARSLGLAVVSDPRLREIDLGEWQGLTEEEVKLWDGERLAWVRQDNFNHARPGGESWQQVGTRGAEALREIVGAHPESSLLVVSHGGTIRVTLQHLKLIDSSYTFIENCSRTIISYEPATSGWTLIGYNLIDHLAALRDPKITHEG
jgi:probable phosphoglycerate mutase